MELGRQFRALALGVVGCVYAASAPGAVEYRDGWVRAMPPGQDRTAAYGSLVNTGTEAAEVLGGSAAVAARVELHETRVEDGVARMRPRPVVILQPGERAVLEPGGLHLMLMDIARMPADDAEVTVCFDVRGQAPACDDVPMRRDAPASRGHP